jgi:uncharacterized protein (TIGR02594 family)
MLPLKKPKKLHIMNHILIALSQFGIHETVGVKDNPEVLKYFDGLGFDGTFLKDETSWCAAFVNWCLKEGDKPYLRKLNARSLLQVGEKVDKPQVGDIVVLWRESKTSWKGHVGFYVSEDKNNVLLLGGNQGNKVCILPYAKYRVLEYRRV